ncbi:choline/carnitine/betaine transport [Mumia flava]|uniref:Choline/carnitine/betaine transport n=1 Tax=Mumia flava TaxID=1348852 RepID=A0A2M9B6V0_9ACTN|nr:BCCT family transporter [Mumia flava]PJJ53669.1 choline/carnitine/betaine transport [Mumia flava]
MTSDGDEAARSTAGAPGGGAGKHRVRPRLTSWSEYALTPRRTRRPGTGQERPVDRVVFGITAVLSVGFVVWGIAATDSLTTVADEAQSWVIGRTGWLYVVAASYFVVFVIWLAASRYGRIPLGDDDEEPEFRTTSWIAMMFSAGMGIGLMFWGVAEPLSHYVAPPPGTSDPETIDAVQTAMATTMFHWALQPWAMYAVVGVAIAYSTFRRGRSQLISSVFRPLIGPRADGPVGKLIDVLAIFATLFGSAVSLGLGALQIGSGLEFLGWADNVGTDLLVAIITVLTICFIASAVSGLARGVQALANVNMWLAVALAVFVFVAGPTLFILNMLPTALGDYLTDYTAMASRTDVSGGAEMQTWLSQWTIFYWAWWISWTPFVGLFIARISRGRTIREFVTGVLLVPCLVSLVWFAIFGTAGIDAERTSGGLTDADGAVDSDFALFRLLEQYPLESVTAVLVMLLVAIFFVSGADAASIVMGSLSQHGAVEPGRSIVVFWGVATGAVAAIMLVLGGADALNGLQSVTVVTSLPFAVVMLLLTIALAKDLRTDRLSVRRDIAYELVREAVSTGIDEHGPDFVIATTPVTRGPQDPEPSARQGPSPAAPDPEPDADPGDRDGPG